MGVDLPSFSAASGCVMDRLRKELHLYIYEQNVLRLVNYAPLAMSLQGHRTVMGKSLGLCRQGHRSVGRASGRAEK